MFIINSANDANGASTCTNVNIMHAETICTSNGLILNSLELDRQRYCLYPMNSVYYFHTISANIPTDYASGATTKQT